MEAHRTDRFHRWNGEVMAQPVEGAEGLLQLLRPSGASRSDDHPVEVRQRPEGQDDYLSDEAVGRTGPADGSGDGDVGRTRQSGLVARIVRRVRVQGDSGEEPSSDAD